MEWRPTIKPEELSQYQGFLPNLTSDLFTQFISKLLGRVSKFVGLPVLLALPEDIIDFAGDKENLRAIRILHRLREEGFLHSFYTETPYYGDEPRGKLTFVQVEGERRIGFSGKGSHISDRKKTLWPALGEVVERLCLNHTYVKEEEWVESSWSGLVGDKVDIFNISGFTDTERSVENPYYHLSMDKDSVFRWVPAVSLPEQKIVWAPLQLFSFDHIHTHVSKNSPLIKDGSLDPEPLLIAPISTGAATGQTQQDALYAGLLEVVERDAFMIYWLNQIPANRIDIRSFESERFQELVKIMETYDLEVHALHLKTDMPAHVICSVMIDRTGIGPAVMVGAKCGKDFEEVVYDSFEETLANRNSLRGMMKTNEDKFPISDEDIEHLGHLNRMLYWFQKENIPKIEHFISGPLVRAKDIGVESFANNQKDHFDQVVKVMKQMNYEIFYRELISPRLKQLTENLSVVMVKVPQMQTLYLEEVLKETKGTRLLEVPNKLGIKVSGGFSTTPHPFP